jgi:drug/metabolite transporter (DMT)-like permease
MGRVSVLLSAVLFAFAGNSLLCRGALLHGGIGPASFTVIRLAAGALALELLRLRTSPQQRRRGGTWPGGLALGLYAGAFSFAYVRLPAGVGAIVLFGMVQVTMLSWSLARGARLGSWSGIGWGLAACGLGVLVGPAAVQTLGATPDPWGVAAMATAGIAWGAYSVLGAGATDPVAATTGNFGRAVLLAAPLVLLGAEESTPSLFAIGLAVTSGAVTSALGYVAWYAVLPRLDPLVAAASQLAVPVVAAWAGVLVLGEAATWRLLVAALMVGGGALAGAQGRQTPRARVP